MTGSPYVSIGRIARPHGTSGEVGIDGDLALLGSLEAQTEFWFVPPPDGPRSATLVSVRSGPKGPLARLSGIDDPDRARALTGSTVLVHESSLPEGPPSDGPDAVGIHVTEVDGRDLGAVRRTIVTGANDVWVTVGPLGEVLIPVIDDVVIEIDHGSGTALVKLLPGLEPE